MKINVMFDSAGNVVAASAPAYRQAPSKTELEASPEVGFAETPGHTVREIDISDDLAQHTGEELLRRLSQADAVKQALTTITTAGQGEISTTISPVEPFSDSEPTVTAGRAD